MKIVLFLLIYIFSIYAQDLIYPDGSVEQFTSSEDKSRSINKVYYKNGIVSPKTSYIDTRKIYVSFGEKRDIKAFSKRYQLQFLKVTNKKFYTVLFALENNADLLLTCSMINQNEDVRYAKPHWRSPRSLK